MKIKGIIFEDFVNYKKPCMVVEMPVCKGFKCDKECGKRVCQNSALATAEDIEIRADKITSRYLTNPITQAIVFQGLEPLDSWEDTWELIAELRRFTLDDIVIYTGYTEEEVYNMRYVMSNLRQYPNIVIKFGRYIPGSRPHYDDILGVNLASKNQYARKIT